MSLLNWLSGWPEPTPPAFPGFTEQDSTLCTDTLENLKPPDNADGIQGLIIAIGYGDASGFSSRRRVRCEKVWREGGALYIRGWCYLRNDDRTFRVDRITSLLHAPGATAEPDPVAYIARFLSNDPLEKAIEARRRHHEAWQELRDGLLVLAYLANADRVAVPAEWHIVSEYAVARLTAQKVPASPDVIAPIISDTTALFPTIRQVAFAARRIEEEPGHLPLLAPFIEALIRADGTISEIEITTLRAFRQRVERVRRKK